MSDLRRICFLFLPCFLIGACADSPPLTSDGDGPTYEGRSVSDWTDLLESHDRHTRRRAVRALAELGPASAPAAAELVRLFRRTVEEFSPNRRPWDRDFMKDFHRAFREIGAPAASSLLRLLKHPCLAVRLESAEALAIIAPPNAAAAPILASMVENPHTRYTAIPALASMGEAARSDLIKLLAHRVADVRQAAVTQLAGGGAFMLPHMRERLRDEDPMVREATVRTLVKIAPDDPDVRAGLFAAVHDQEGAVRAAAVRALSEIVPEAETLLPVLIGALGDDAARPAATEGLVRLGPDAAPAVPILVAHLRDKWNRDSDKVTTILQAFPAMSMPFLVEKLKSPERDTSDLAADILGQMGKTSRPALLEALNDPASRRGAVKALHPRHQGAEAKGLIHVYVGLLRDPVEDVRNEAADALGSGHLGGEGGRAYLDAVRLGDPANRLLALKSIDYHHALPGVAVPVLLDLLQDPDPKLRAEAAEELGVLCAEPENYEAATWITEPDKDPVGPSRRAAAVSGLIAGLEDSDPDVRRESAGALGRIGSAAKSAVPAMIRRLIDPDNGVRFATIDYIGWIGSAAAEAVPSVIPLLQDPDAEVRRVVMETIGRIGPAAREAVPALVERLHVRQDDISAMSGLAAIGPAAKSAVPALLSIVKPGTHSHSGFPKEHTRAENDEINRRLAALEALGGIGAGSAPAVPELAALIDRDDDLADEIPPVLAKIGGPAVPVLIRLLDQRDPDRRIKILQLLGGIGSRETSVVPALARALGDPVAEVRDAAAQALWETGPAAAEAIPALNKVLRGDDTNVRDSAATALAILGPAAATAVPALIESARNPCFCGDSIGYALSEIGGPAIPHLIRAFSDSELREWAVREFSFSSFDKISVPSLIEALSDSDPDIREGAAGALGYVGDRESHDLRGVDDQPPPPEPSAAREAVPDLIRVLNDESAFVREAAAEALGKIGPDSKSAIPDLMKRLADDDSGVRAAALGSIRGIDPQTPGLTNAALRLTRDKSEGVRWNAIWALPDEPPYDSSIITALIMAARDASDPIRRTAVRQLAKIAPTDPTAYDEVMAALGDLDPYVRQDAIQGLEKCAFGRADVIPALTERLKDRDPGVRKVARKVLENIRKSHPPH